MSYVSQAHTEYLYDYELPIFMQEIKAAHKIRGSSLFAFIWIFYHSLAGTVLPFVFFFSCGMVIWCGFASSTLASFACVCLRFWYWKFYMKFSLLFFFLRCCLQCHHIYRTISPCFNLKVICYCCCLFIFLWHHHYDCDLNRKYCEKEQNCNIKKRRCFHENK